MFERLVKSIMDYIVILFLLLCLFTHTVFNQDFKWGSLANTDGLTLVGIVLALLSSILVKFPLFRRLVGAILLKTNFHHLDYSIEVLAFAPIGTTTTQIFDIFSESVISSGLTSNDYNIKYEDLNKITFYHRAIAGNIEISKTTIIEQGRDCYLIKIDSVSAYRSIENNIKFIGNCFLEDIMDQTFSLKNINVRISKKNSEYKVAQMGLLLSARKYKVQHSHIEIQSSRTTKITIDSNTGVSMISTSRGDFLNSIDALKTVLMS
ncbi:hypothetical protein [Paenibacillus sp. IHBB 3054]|uniref:hypothetical protein n=1 Tax=Paenibacillus sp. IHBB 3054 TaxID=3425689 RepID=UPI003F6682CC